MHKPASKLKMAQLFIHAAEFSGIRIDYHALPA
jgi:hypothetical protein